MINNKNEIIFNKEVISSRVSEIAKNINSDFKGKSLDIICLVNSSLIFTSDLIRKIDRPIRLHIFDFSPIKEAKSGEVVINLDIKSSISGKNVLIIEGMIISGKTPKYIYDYLKNKYKPLSLDFCVVGYKPHLLVEEVPIKYYGFKFKNQMVCGYGIGSDNQKKLDHLLNVDEN